MLAGELDQSILFKRKVATRDNKGGEVVTYVPLSKRTAAKAEPVDGKQYEALQQIQSDVDVFFTVHYRTDVQSDWRTEWRNVDYEIIGPPIDVRGRKQWLRVKCRTAQA